MYRADYAFGSIGEWGASNCVAECGGFPITTVNHWFRPRSGDGPGLAGGGLLELGVVVEGLVDGHLEVVPLVFFALRHDSPRSVP